MNESWLLLILLGLGLVGVMGLTSARWPLDTPLFEWAPGVPFTYRDSFQGVQVLGGVGSGKTSGSGRTLQEALFRHGYGGLILCSKVSDLEDYLEVARSAGRMDSVLVFEDGGPWRFNWLDYEWNRPGPGSRNILSLMQQFGQLNELADRGQGQQAGGGSDPYWGRSRLQCIRNAVQLVALARGDLTLQDICEVIEGIPQGFEQVEDEAWKEESAVYRMMDAVSDQLDDLSPSDAEDFDLIGRYFLHFMAGLAVETLSPIKHGALGLFDGFLTQPLRGLFAGTTNVVPEMAFEGAIILVNLPIKEYGEAGRLANVAWKLAFQRACERRDVNTHPRPVFLFCDEAHQYITPFDQVFAATARSQRVCVTFLFQNVDTLITSIGTSWHARHLVNAMLGNLATTIFHANTSPETNQWAADRIGQDLQWRLGGSSSNPNPIVGLGQASANISEMLLHQVLPLEFQHLRTGGPENDFLVDAIVARAGRPFPGGRNFLRTSFRQVPKAMGGGTA